MPDRTYSPPAWLTARCGCSTRPPSTPVSLRGSECLCGARDRASGVRGSARYRGGAVLDQISTSIFADGADLDGILALAADPRIAGFTPNLTRILKAGLPALAMTAT